MNRLAYSFAAATSLILAAHAACAASSKEDPKFFCEKLWDDDFVMQQKCVKSQTDALTSIFSIKLTSEKSPTMRKILGICDRQWSNEDGSKDYVMMEKCIGKQSKAYYEMNLQGR